MKKEKSQSTKKQVKLAFLTQKQKDFYLLHMDRIRQEEEERKKDDVFQQPNVNY